MKTSEGSRICMASCWPTILKFLLGEGVGERSQPWPGWGPWYGKSIHSSGKAITWYVPFLHWLCYNTLMTYHNSHCYTMMLWDSCWPTCPIKTYSMNWTMEISLMKKKGGGTGSMNNFDVFPKAISSQRWKGWLTFKWMWRSSTRKRRRAEARSRILNSRREPSGNYHNLLQLVCCNHWS